jgi:hypothetical protein
VLQIFRCWDRPPFLTSWLLVWVGAKWLFINGNNRHAVYARLISLLSGSIISETCVYFDRQTWHIQTESPQYEKLSSSLPRLLHLLHCLITMFRMAPPIYHPVRQTQTHNKHPAFWYTHRNDVICRCGTWLSWLSLPFSSSLLTSSGMMRIFWFSLSNHFWHMLLNKPNNVLDTKDEVINHTRITIKLKFRHIVNIHLLAI